MNQRPEKPLTMTDRSTSPTSNATSATSSTLDDTKYQPWRAVWPAPREADNQAQIYGFKKGETMVFDGNAGNFFARDGWTVEQESDKKTT